MVIYDAWDSIYITWFKFFFFFRFRVLFLVNFFISSEYIMLLSQKRKRKKKVNILCNRITFMDVEVQNIKSIEMMKSKTSGGGRILE